MPSTKISRKKRPPLDRSAWVLGALKLLARDGIDGVRVEVLANKLGVTKGSFYWHFKDRPALYKEMLDYWRQEVVLQIMERLKAIDDPKQRFQSMIRLPFDKNPPNFELELAVRLWARRDRQASTALAKADELRIQFIVDVLTAAGAPTASARSRALLIFAFLRLGSELMDEASLKHLEKWLIAP